MAYAYIFKVKVRLGLDEEFILHWTNGSIPIQQNAGALGTRLRKVRGEEGVYIAVAEWETKEARAEAFANLEKPGPLRDEYLKWKENHEFGEVELIGEADDVSSVVLSR